MAQQDATRLKYLRNIYYRDYYRVVMVMIFFAIFVILILVCVLTYFLTHPQKTPFYATNKQAAEIPLVALSQPNLSDDALLKWANTAAISAYTYNFVNYQAQLESTKKYFTEAGWQAFVINLRQSNLVKNVVANKVVVTSAITGAPVILEQGDIDGVYTWKIQMPMLVTYESASQVLRQHLVITMLITRISTLKSDRGIGIVQFTASTGGIPGFQ